MLKRNSFQLLHALARKKTMFENVNIDWNLSHDDGSTDFSDEETLEDHPRTLNRTPDKNKSRPMSIFTPSSMTGADSEELSPGHNRSAGSTSDWSRSNTSDSGDSPGSYRNPVMPPPPPPQSKKPSLCKYPASCWDYPLCTWGFHLSLDCCLLGYNVPL